MDRIPPSDAFESEEVLFGITLAPLAAFLTSPLSKDDRIKLGGILDGFRTPKSYHRIDRRLDYGPPPSLANGGQASNPSGSTTVGTARATDAQTLAAGPPLSSQPSPSNHLVSPENGNVVSGPSNELVSATAPAASLDATHLTPAPAGGEPNGSAEGAQPASVATEPTVGVTVSDIEASLLKLGNQQSDSLESAPLPFIPPPSGARLVREFRIDLRTLDPAALFHLETWRREKLCLEPLPLAAPLSKWYAVPLPVDPPRKRGRPRKHLLPPAEPPVGVAGVAAATSEAPRSASPIQVTQATPVGQSAGEIGERPVTAVGGAEAETAATDPAQPPVATGANSPSGTSVSSRMSPEILLPDAFNDNISDDPDFVPAVDLVRSGRGRGRGSSRASGAPTAQVLGASQPESEAGSAFSTPAPRGRPRGRPRGSGRGARMAQGDRLTPASSQDGRWTPSSLPVERVGSYPGVPETSTPRGRPRGRPRGSGRGARSAQGDRLTPASLPADRVGIYPGVPEPSSSTQVSLGLYGPQPSAALSRDGDGTPSQAGPSISRFDSPMSSASIPVPRGRPRGRPRGSRARGRGRVSEGLERSQLLPVELSARSYWPSQLSPDGSPAPSGSAPPLDVGIPDDPPLAESSLPSTSSGPAEPGQPPLARPNYVEKAIQVETDNDVSQPAWLGRLADRIAALESRAISAVPPAGQDVPAAPETSDSPHAVPGPAKRKRGRVSALGDMAPPPLPSPGVASPARKRQRVAASAEPVSRVTRASSAALDEGFRVTRGRASSVMPANVTRPAVPSPRSLKAARAAATPARTGREPSTLSREIPHTPSRLTRSGSVRPLFDTPARTTRSSSVRPAPVGNIPSSAHGPVAPLPRRAVRKPQTAIRGRVKRGGRGRGAGFGPAFDSRSQGGPEPGAVEDSSSFEESSPAPPPLSPRSPRDRVYVNLVARPRVPKVPWLTR